MDKTEAYAILTEKLSLFLNYTKLVPFVDNKHVEHFQVCGQYGTLFLVEIHILWDPKNTGYIQVSGTVEYADGVGPVVRLNQALLIPPPPLNCDTLFIPVRQRA